MELRNRLYTILRLISCDYSVVTERVAALCTETQLLCIDRIGDWIKFSPTIHELLAHSATCMEAVGSRGFLFVTEESLESSNKVLNKTRGQKAQPFGAAVQQSTFFHLKAGQSGRHSSRSKTGRSMHSRVSRFFFLSI